MVPLSNSNQILANNADPRENAAGYAQELLTFLAENRQSLSPFLILPHDYPDPDALASAFALNFLAREGYGIESRIAYSGVIGRKENRAMVSILRIPVHRLRPGDLKKYKQIALVDTQPSFTNNSFPKNRKAAIVIDQHPSEINPAADLVLVDTGCGATCVILAQALLLQNVEIPERVATALAYGILSDTLNLYRARRPDVVQTYLSILQHADMRALAQIQNPVRSKRFFATLARCLNEALVYRTLIVAHLRVIENPDLVSQMAEFLLTYKAVRWSMCSGRYKGGLHVSLRSTNPDAEAGEKLREAFGNRKQAGGHGAIAGGSLRVGANATEDVWHEKEQTLVERLLKGLHISIKAEPRKPFGRSN